MWLHKTKGDFKLKKITYLAPLMLMFFIAFTGIVHSETASPVKVTSITASDTKINKSTIFTVTGENLPELFGKKGFKRRR